MTNWKCAWGFGISLGAALALGISFVLIMLRTAQGIAAVLLIIAMPTTVWALVLAALGVRECIREPEKYARGRARGLLTLILGSIGGVFLIIVVAGAIAGIKEARETMRDRNIGSRSELLNFSAMNFILQSPGPLWIQTDARMFGPGCAVAFTRSGSVCFTVAAIRLDPAVSDSRQRLVETSQRSDQKQATAYRLISSGELRRHGLDGWQTESQASIQGHDYYCVHWIVATNGFGYKLSLWGPPDSPAQLKEEAEHLFSKFEVTGGASSQPSVKN